MIYPYILYIYNMSCNFYGLLFIILEVHTQYYIF